MADTPESYFRLDGKVALVTGAARGLGAAMAETLAAAGARVCVTDVQDAGAIEDKLKAAGAEAASFAHDVTDEAQWESVVGGTVDALGGLDVLVNNAGVESMALFENCDLKEFRRIQAVNVEGVFLGIKHGIRAMKPGGQAGRGGAIVNLSSVAGLIGVTGLGAYCTSKGAVRLMSKAAAIECGQLGYGIRVNSVHPAVVKTHMGQNLVHEFVKLGLAADEKEAEQALLALHPMGRYGEPVDIANAVLYLSSPAASWITGSELVVDGGATAD